MIGTLYHGKAKPPETWYNDADNIKAIRTRSGHTIEFHDTEGEELIKIYDNEKDNFVLTFSTHEQLIKLESANNIELYAKNDIMSYNVIADISDNGRFSLKYRLLGSLFNIILTIKLMLACLLLIPCLNLMSS